jgi:tRNA 2-thiouridine synthesizing protein A
MPESSVEDLLDAKGLFCPLPIIKTRLALNRLPVGGVLTVLVTDPASVIDFRHFCNTTGNELVSFSEAEGVFTYGIRRTV